jgi:hypothetical protein
MGTILCTRRYEHSKDKIIVEVLMHQEEFRQLRGELDDVYLFSQRVSTVPSKMSLRGRNEATKYFLIPRELRKKIAIFGEVGCQRFDHDGKSIFIYVLDPCKDARRSCERREISYGVREALAVKSG